MSSNQSQEAIQLVSSFFDEVLTVNDIGCEAACLLGQWWYRETFVSFNLSES